MQGNWTDDVNNVLDKIRVNSITLSNEHKKTYFVLASYIKWFRVPVIFLSAAGSILGMALVPHLPQTVVTVTCSVISMSVGLIGSVELFLGIGNKMESELVQSKELYLLAIELQKTLLLDPLNRNGDGIAYLEDKFNVYSKLIENSYLLESRIIDELTPLPNEFRVVFEKTPSEESNRSWFFPKRRRRKKRPELGVLDVNRFRNMRKVEPAPSPEQEASPEDGNTPTSIKIKLNDQPSNSKNKYRNSLNSMSPLTNETEFKEYRENPPLPVKKNRRGTVEVRPAEETSLRESIRRGRERERERAKELERMTYPGITAAYRSDRTPERSSQRKQVHGNTRLSLLVPSPATHTGLIQSRGTNRTPFLLSNVMHPILDQEPPMSDENTADYSRQIKDAVDYIKTKFVNNANQPTRMSVSISRRDLEGTQRKDPEPDLEVGKESP